LSLLLICFLGLFGCSKVTDRSQVIGTYEAHHRNGIETLELQPDGTYKHHFSAADGIETTYSNKWEFEPYYGEPQVALHNFSPYFPQNSHTEPVGITLLGIQHGWGAIRLYLNYDRDEYYSKKAVK
jgi:hypothetical protein